MGKNSKSKLLPFEKILQTFPECDLVKKNKLYISLNGEGARKQGFLELLFRLLKEFSQNDSPDHAAFKALITPALKTYRYPTQMIYQGIQNGNGTSMEDASQLMSTVAAIYYSLLKGYDGVLPDRAVVVRRYVLLKEVLFPNNQSYIEAFYESLLHPTIVTAENLGKFSKKPTIFEVKEHLEYALQHGFKLKAHRLAGYLESLADKYEPGEVQYLSALVWLRENNREEIEEAISELCQIPKFFRLYKDSRGMLAEAYARLGDADHLNDIINNDDVVDPVSMRAYLQLLVRNTEFYSASMNQLQEDPDRYYSPHDKVQVVFDSFYDRYGCTSEIEPLYHSDDSYYLSLRLCRENILYAIKEIYGYYLNAAGVESVDSMDMIIPASVLRAKAMLILSAEDIYRDLKALVMDNTPDNRFAFLERWFPCTLRSDGEAYARDADLWLEAYRTIALDTEFVDGFVENWRELEDFPGLNVTYWLSEAYLAAITCGHEQQSLLYDKLLKFAPDFEQSYMDDIQYKKVNRLLDKQGKLLYAAAQHEYDAALLASKDQGWRDSGMIALGFFRIVEVEFRNRIVTAVFTKSNKTVKKLNKELSKLDKKLSADDFEKHSLLKEKTAERSSLGANNEELALALKKEIEIIEDDIRRIKGERKRLFLATSAEDEFDFRQTVKNLESPEKFDLGATYYLLRLLSDRYEVDERWSEYLNELKQQLYCVLSPEGIAAQKENKISYRIRLEKLEEYRNPPAHARYLPFEKAIECRDYVNETLLQLHNEWLKK